MGASLYYSGMEQLVACLAQNQEVVGSSPASAIQRSGYINYFSIFMNKRRSKYCKGLSVRQVKRITSNSLSLPLY